jgi:hypothetical protein
VSSLQDPWLIDPFAEIADPLALREAELPGLRLPELAPSPERAVVRKRRAAALVGSAAWLAVLLAVLGIRHDLPQLPLFYTSAQLILPPVLAVVALMVALGAGKRGLGVKVGLVSALAILGPASFAVIALAAPVPGAVPAGVATLPGILFCFEIAVACTSLPLMFAALTLRGAFPAAARWRSALVGAGTGLFAGATMNLICPNVAPLHLLFGHGLPVIIATLAGALVLSLRSRT